MSLIEKNKVYYLTIMAALGCFKTVPTRISQQKITQVKEEKKEEKKEQEDQLEISIEDYLEEKGIKPEYEYMNKWWKYPLNIAGGYFLAVGWHEFGHYTAAHLLGCKDVKIDVFPNSGTVAHVKASCPELNVAENTFFSTAGIGFTTTGNIGLTSLLITDSIHESMKPFVATTSLIMMLDRHRYLWSSAIKNYARMNIPRSDDIHSVIKSNFSSQKDVDYWYGVTLSASAIEFFLRKDEIWYLINTAIDRKIKVPEDIDGIKPGIYPAYKGFLIGITGDL